MKIKVYSKNDRSVSNWAGGSTTQLWILPKDGNYASRDFKVRISSATVQTEDSDFTILPDVVRYITPLSGGFTLSHKDGRKITMAPLDPPYRFDGGIATHCVGKATDFNLMLKGVEGNMAVINGRFTTASSEICCVYPVDGDVTVDGESLNLSKGDLAVILTEKGEQAVIETTKAIVCIISDKELQ